jgi:hypothetical protein
MRSVVDGNCGSEAAALILLQKATGTLAMSACADEVIE